jgi:uncharacterized protein
MDINSAYKYKIILNNACNMNCVYCFHDKKKELFKGEIISPEEMSTFFPENKEYTFTFFGGEPLLSYDYLKTLCKLLKEKNQKIKFNMITNGTLLTDEKVKFLNEFDIRTIISHDGISHKKTRKIDPLEQHGEVIAKIKNLSFLMTLTTLNWDLYKSWDFFDDFRNTYKIKKPVVAYAGVRDMLHNIDESLLLYNHEGFENVLDKVFLNLEKDIENGNFDSYEYKAHRRIVNKLYKTIAFKTEMAPCHAPGNVITFDTNGNLYSCHNSNIICGNIKNLSNIHIEPFIKKNICNNCQIKDFCIKCPKVVKDKEKYYCYFSLSVMSRMLKMLDKLLMKEILK